MVKRYVVLGYDPEITEVEKDGEWGGMDEYVLYTDYQKLEQEVEMLREELNNEHEAALFWEAKGKLTETYLDDLEKAESQLKASEDRVAELEGAINWALGIEGDFPSPDEYQGRYGWRRQLRVKAGLPVYKYDTITQALQGDEG